MLNIRVSPNDWVELRRTLIQLAEAMNRLAERLTKTEKLPAELGQDATLADVIVAVNKMTEALK